ncbi:mitochondrial carrier protein [Basidiobolus meristosporus CBS 931.73]|uniref:Mitochondrial carrier protein n=1 Tax=Basidiobolus meristosporus CBS 931.73 TaxID=1314790 RepID=A0A1Y1YFU4_9FUNG|nr:mitochondrial carrier protein [Basidiobolus meristosporus CBS 931.73]|eukprot:ORX96882.1 mitochondrial carrier protein [Basidiobolus meristosporus CBS 931.73]
MLQEKEGKFTASKTESVKPQAKPLSTVESTSQQAWLHFVAGGVGGMIGSSLTCPLDVVKTRLQSSLYKPTPTFYSHAHRTVFSTVSTHVVETIGILKTIHHQEGVRGLFKGLGPILVGVVPARAIYFAAYGSGKRFLSDLNGGKETSLVHLSAAASAGIITATATSPIWLVKTRIQLQAMEPSAIRYKNSLDCAYQVVKTEGVLGLYRGVSASYLGVTEGTLQWVVYEKLKSMIHRRRRAENDEGVSTENKSFGDWMEYFAAAGTAKLFAAVVTYPHEVVRTRLRQTPSVDGVHKYTGLTQCFKLILKEEGVAALYGGMTAHVMRAVPNAAIMFFCYEAIIHTFGQQQQRNANA